jgi:hypothetical protein
MKKILFTLFALMFVFSISRAQTTAMDFTKTDCNGKTHHLFTELDSDHLVITEYFMTCSMCVNAAHGIESMLTRLNKTYPGKIKWYQMAFTNSYNCATVKGFIQSNGFKGVPFDSGAALVAYYGGFGMPTISVAAGKSHKVLFTTVGYSSNDTVQISNAAKAFFGKTGIKEDQYSAGNTISIVPNPAKGNLNIDLNLSQNAEVEMKLFDLSGKEISGIYKGHANAGIIRNNFNLENIPQGIYFVKANINGVTVCEKVSVIK